MSHQVDPRKVREISLAEKKEIMWNVIEPGDPYDIRKSMIAQLPGHRKFMGPHLQLVCLLQAAEIQRLCLFLEEHRLKLRESERVSLDRHSYEIQIKQLSEKLLIDEGLRNENIKLKQFIRKQSKELEEVQRQQNVSQITNKYQSSLAQVQQLIYQNKQLKLSIEQLQSELAAQQETTKAIQQARSKDLQALEANLKQQFLLKEQQKDREYKQIIEEKLHQDQQRLFALQEYQNRFYLLAEEIDRLNSCLRDKSKEANEQNIRYQQLNDEKKHIEEQNLDLQTRNRALLVDIGTLERQKREIIRQKSTYEQRQTLIHQHEFRIQKLSIQVDRLNGVLRKKINELEEYKKKVRDQQLSISNFQLVERETDELRAKFSQVSKKLFDYEKQTTVQNQEIDRLNMTLKRMVEQINYAEAKIKTSERQLDSQIKRCLILENDLDQHTKSHHQLRETNRVIIGDLKEENEHLKNKMLNFQRIYQQNNVLKAQLEQAVTQKYEISKQLTQKIQSYSREVQALNGKIIRQEKQISQQLSAKEYLYQMQNLKEELFRLNSERSILNQKLQKLSTDNQLLTSQNQQQRRKVEEMDEYYRKVIIFSEEITRLNSVIASRQKQVQECHDNMVDYQQKIKYLQQQISMITVELQQCKRASHEKAKIQDYQQQIQILKGQFQKSRQKDALIKTYQDKITVIGSQIERLNVILKQKLQGIQQLQKTNSHLKFQNDELKQQLKHTSSHDKLIAEYDRRISEQSNQLQRVVVILRQREDELKSLTQQYTRGRQTSNNQMARITQKLVSYQQNITNYLAQIDRLNRILQGNPIQIYKNESKDPNYLSQIQRLNNLLRIKIEECEYKTLDLRKYGLEIDELKDKLNEERREKEMINQHKEMFSQEVVKAKQQMYTYEARIKELYEEFQRLQIVMKTLKEDNQNVAALHLQIQDLIQKNRWLGSQIDQLNSTLEAQDQQLMEFRLKLSDHSSLQNRVNQDLGLMVVLFAEIESLRRRIEEREQQAREMRRSNVMQYRV